MQIEYIIESFCEARDIAANEVMDGSRNNKVWSTQYMIWYYLHYSVEMSASKIAKIFKRSRPSIFRGIRLLKHQMKYNKELRAEYHGIVAKIEGMTDATPSENMED